MAVVQISKIQIRRDIKDPDTKSNHLEGISLSSGEMAWCINTNQLYIGNPTGTTNYDGSNVEILTEYSDIFTIGKYTYGPIATGTERTIQERLDDRVNAKSFGITDHPVIDQSPAINIAIEKLYKETLQGNGRVDLRSTLEFSPGVYIIREPIYIYSYTKIVGSGQGRTIFQYEGTGSAFIFVHDSYNPTLSKETNRSNIGSGNICRNVSLSEFTLEVNNSNTTAFDMFCVRNSEFKNLTLKSTWDRDIGANIRTNSVGILMGVTSELITCEYNEFINVSVDSFRLGLSARGDIVNNVIRDCKFTINEISINFGYYNVNPNLIPPVGEQYGPRNNVISTCSFYRVEKQAIKVWQGYGNVSSKNNFRNVGNNRGGNISALYSQVEFDQPNNISVDDFSDRHKDLGFLGPDAFTVVPYISEVTGYGLYQNNFSYTLPITYNASSTELFRFPVPKSSTPNVGPLSCEIEINYLYRSSANDINYRRLRKGSLTLLVDTRNFASSIPDVEIIDDYDYLGYGLETGHSITDIEDEVFIFEAELEQQNNQWQVKVSYKYNISPNKTTFTGSLERGTITYTYKILS